MTGTTTLITYSAFILLLALNSASQQSAFLWGLQTLEMGTTELESAVQQETLSTLVCFTVLLVTLSVAAYAQHYMTLEPYILRFNSVLLLFALSMLLLVGSTSWDFMLMGWDGLGVTSYFLVLYYNNASSLTAAKVTVMSNRVGDVLIISVILLGLSTSEGTWWIESASLSYFYYGLITVAVLTKSAQFPFSAWLPEAMAAPTPVSALVHSSTLVTAGVFLILRCSMASSSVNWGLLIIISGYTLFYATLSSMFTFDCKKLVALSTLSQISFIIVTCVAGLYSLAVLHLVTHALFKSSLFMNIGGLLHFSLSSQDSRLAGSLLSSSTSLGASLSVLSMAGLPFLTGFYSKEAVLMMAASSSSLNVALILVMGSVGTILYSSRIMSALYLNNSAVTAQTKGDYLITATLLTLLLFVVASGSFVSEEAILRNSGFSVLIGWLMLSVMSVIMMFHFNNDFHTSKVLSLVNTDMIMIKSWSVSSLSKSTAYFLESANSAMDFTWLEMVTASSSVNMSYYSSTEGINYSLSAYGGFIVALTSGFMMIVVTASL